MFIGHWDGFCREELGCESFTKIGMSNILAFFHLRISISRHENMPCALGSYTRLFAKFVHMYTSSFRLREHKPQFIHLGLDVFFSFNDHENDNVHMCTNSTFWSSMVGNVALIGSQE